jgi:hypothetical protein
MEQTRNDGNGRPDAAAIAQMRSQLEGMLGAQECQDECFGAAALTALGELAGALGTVDALTMCLSASLRRWSQQHGGASSAPPWWPTLMPSEAPSELLCAALAAVERIGPDLRPDVVAALRGALLVRMGHDEEASGLLLAAIAQDARTPERYVDFVVATARCGDRKAALRALQSLRTRAAEPAHADSLRWRRALAAATAALGA